MKYANFLLLGVLLFAGYLLKDSIHISTNLLSLFAPKEAISKLHIANELGYSKEMLVALKYKDKSTTKELKLLAQELQEIKNIESVTYKLALPQEIKEYYKTHYTLLAAFDDKEQTQELVKAKLQTLYNKQLTNFFYSPINKNDPLSLFEMQESQSVSHKGKYLQLGEYGYLLRVKTNVPPSDMNAAKILYDDVNALLKRHKNAVAFAPFFYTVENSAKIKGDVEWIVALSTLLLLLVYFVMLRDIKLLFHTVITLLSAMIFSALICTTTIENFSVLSLAFGATLSAVSIDYLLHYYFHGFFHSDKKFDRSVFFGFFTTIAAFGVFAFIPVALIAQISIFAVLSLSFSYVVFTFLYRELKIKKTTLLVSEKKREYRVPSAAFTLVSILLLAYTFNTMQFDNNIRNLDYQNEKLQKLQTLFQTANTNNLYPVIVEADSKEALLKHLHLLKEAQKHSFSFASFIPQNAECEKRRAVLNYYDFVKLNALINTQASEIGFREGYFAASYKDMKSLPSCEDIELSVFKPYNLNVFEEDKKFYTIAMVEDIKRADEFVFVSPIDVKSMFAKVADKMFSDIVMYASGVMLLIVFLLLISVKKQFFYALNYLLFPLSLSLFIVSSFYSINIMHLFGLIILSAIGIDYGIYMSNTSQPSRTMLAIRYSLFSTFAAFGVLIFSTITALNSIGLVITLGCGAIFLLIRVMR